MFNDSNNIIFFDGYCVLCNSTIDFLLKSDKKKRFLFSSLQSKTASTVFSNLGYSTEEMSELDSLVYVRNQQIKIRSDAILSILFDLGGIYRMSAIFYLTLKFFRDAIYDQIASRRYQWFGKRSICRVPNAEEENRILA
jgi:predicted DCC family thiol-disulfide oxidoreductase YuxK